MISITDLLRKIGDENLKVQLLHQCMESAKYEKGITEIKIATDGLSATDLVDNKKSALIVWVNVADFNNALAACKGES